MAGCRYAHDGTDSAPHQAKSGKAHADQKHPFLLQLNIRIDVVSTISTSATV